MKATEEVLPYIYTLPTCPGSNRTKVSYVKIPIASHRTVGLYGNVRVSPTQALPKRGSLNATFTDKSR